MLLLLLLSLFIIIITIIIIIIIVMLIIINIIVMLINITFTAILEKSGGGEFQARNSNGMVYPYSSREVMDKPFQTRI